MIFTDIDKNWYFTDISVIPTDISNLVHGVDALSLWPKSRRGYNFKIAL